MLHDDVRSGNVLADRRFDYAMALKAEGETEAAADLLEQTAELAPSWAALYFALGECREILNDRDSAVAAYAKALANEPEDVLGAEVRLALLGASPVPAILPEAYVRTLFDQYAARFDKELLQSLAYRAPYDLLAALDRATGPATQFGRVLDLGCGTGLMGETLRQRAAWLEGVDLSPAMITEAERKRLYDRLTVQAADVELKTATPASFDLITAADVLVYIGELDTVVQAAARALIPGGFLAATLERSMEDDVQLNGTHRYRHSSAYVERIIAAAGLDLVTLADNVPRTESQLPVAGFIIVARKPMADPRTQGFAGHDGPGEPERGQEAR